MFAQYGLSGVPGLPGMSIPGSAVPGMVSAASPITAGHMAMAGAQYPGLAGIRQWLLIMQKQYTMQYSAEVKSQNT